MKLFLILTFIIPYFFVVSQTFNEKEKILHIIETRDTIGLLNIYEDWSKNSIPIDTNDLDKQYELSKEVYAIYPAILDYFSPGDKNIYVLVNNTIRVEVSSQNLNLDSIYNETMKDFYPNITEEDFKFYPREYCDGIRFFEKEKVNNTYLNPTHSTNTNFILNNFRPHLSDSLFEIIYEDEPKKYLKCFNDAMTDYEIEKSLLKAGKTIEQIRESKGSMWRSYTDIERERESRQNFCYSFRKNVKDRIIRILFQPDFRTAFVEYAHDYNSEDYTTLYFEKNNSKWMYKETYIVKTFMYYDRNLLPIR